MIKRCPTCGQPLPDERAARKVERIIRETKEKSDAEKRQAAVDAAKRTAVDLLQDQLRNLKVARNPYTERLAEAERRRKEFEAAIA